MSNMPSREEMAEEAYERYWDNRSPENLESIVLDLLARRDAMVMAHIADKFDESGWSDSADMVRAMRKLR
jgi:hypothetical protein